MSTVSRWWWDVQLSSINDARVAQFPPRAGVNSRTGVFCSVAEIGGGTTPFQGAAMLSVWNVVPSDDGKVSLVIRVQPTFFGLRVRVQFLLCND